jgi:hypothetical protein
MENAQLGVLITADDQASPVLGALRTTLSDNKMAIRELAMGTTMLGASFMAMGIAMKGTNTVLGNTIGQTLMMAGSVMTAIGSTVQFISAIAKTVHALQSLAAAEAVVKALQGPVGWAVLLGSIGVAAGAVAGISAMNKAEAKTNNVTVHVAGNVTSERNLTDAIRQGIILSQNRNATSGIR